MKIIRTLLIVFSLILTSYIILSVFGPSKIACSESIEINSSSENIYTHLIDFNNWQKWSPWKKKDPNMTQVISGIGLNSKNTWKSHIMGNGSQEIIELEENKRIKTALNFDDWDGTNYAEWTLSSSGNSTQVTWTMDGGNIPFLGRGIMLLMGMNTSISEDYKEGLSALKGVMESKN